MLQKSAQAIEEYQSYDILFDTMFSWCKYAPSVQ